MSKWIFAVLFAVACLAYVPPSVAQAVLRVATIAPDGSVWMREMRAGADEIARRTDGRVRVQFFPGGVMGNDQAVLRRIRIGQLQGGAFTGGALMQVHADAGIYSLPFLFRSHDEVDYVRARMDAVIEKRLEQSGLVSFGIAEGGFANLLSGVPVTRIEDLRGQKVWVPEGDPVAYAGMEALGLAPVTLPLTDVLTGLQTGLINIIASPPIGAVAFQWHTRVRFMTDTPLAYTWAQLVLDRRAVERLRADDREVVREVLRATYERLDVQNRNDNRQALDAMTRQGVRVVSPEAEELERWYTIGEQVTHSLLERGTFSKDLHAEIVGHLEAFRAR